MAIYQPLTLSQERRVLSRPMAGQQGYGLQPRALYAPPDPNTQTPVGGDLPTLIQAMQTSFDNQQALLQEIANQTRVMALSLQQIQSSRAGMTIPGAVMAPNQVFSPSTVAYQDPVIQATARQSTRLASVPPSPDKVTEAHARQQQRPSGFQEAAPSSGRTPTAHEIVRGEAGQDEVIEKAQEAQRNVYDEQAATEDKTDEAEGRQRSRGVYDQAIEGSEDKIMEARAAQRRKQSSGWEHNLQSVGQPGAIRERVATGLQRRIQNLKIGPDLYEAEPGSFVNLGTGQAATTAEVGQFQHVQTLKGGATQFFEQLGGGASVESAAQEGLTAAGLGTAAVGLGVAGAGVAAAVQAKNFYNTQQQANAQWQSILGGSKNEGYGERANEAIFATQQDWFGAGLGSQQARQLYEGAASIYGRDTRSRDIAQDFGTTMWKQLGMNVSESLEMIRTAAKDGNESLTGLGDALTGVSKAARDAGTNADSARQAFQQQYASAADTQSGPTVAGTQGVFTAGTTALGNRFSNVNLSGLNDPTLLRQMAAQQGQSYGGFMADVNQDPYKLANAATDIQQQRVRGYLFQNPQVSSAINQATGNGTKKLSDAEYRTLSDQLLRMGVDPTAMANTLNQAGFKNVTEGESVELAARVVSQESFRYGDQMQRQIGPTASFVLDQGQQSQLKGLGDISGKWGTNLKDAQGNPLGQGLQDMFRMITGGTRDAQGNVSGGDLSLTTDTQKDYARQTQRTGVRNPIVEKLLSSDWAGGSTRFKVQTKDGVRYVTEDQLVRDYAGQAATAQVVKGPSDKQGSTVAEALGMPLTQQATDEAQGTTNEKAKAGDTTAPSGSEDDPNANKGAQQTVRIEASPQLSKYLSFLDSSGNPIDTSRGQGGVSQQPPGYGGAPSGNP